MRRLRRLRRRAFGQLLNVGDGDAAGAGVGAHHAADVAGIDLIRLQMGREEVLAGLELSGALAWPKAKPYCKSGGVC